MNLDAAKDDPASKPRNSNPSAATIATIAKSLGLTIAYPICVLQTRRQVSPVHYSYRNMSRVILRYEGFRGFYKGFGICLLGFITAPVLQSASFKIGQRKFRTKLAELGFPNVHAFVVANAAAVVTSYIALHLVRTPFHVVSQRLRVQGSGGGGGKSIFLNNLNSENYKNALDVFRKILRADGPRGLYRGFGISLFTYFPSSAITFSSYAMIYRFFEGKKRKEGNLGNGCAMVAVNGLGAVVASGVCAIVTTPFDTIKTRLQVLDIIEENGRRRPITFKQTLRNLVNEGGVLACYRGFGARWAASSIYMSAAMLTAHLILKRSSSESQQDKLK